MNITPQDIIDKEFRVKFRGFDMAEVDTFLEEVAESIFKLTEENTLLNEKVLALQQDLEAAGSLSPSSQLELPAELGNILEDLKQDTASMGADLAALKQDRQIFDSLEKNLKAAVASIQETASEMKPLIQQGAPADLANTLEDLKQGSAAVVKELESFKKDSQDFSSLTKRFEELIGSAKDAASAMTHQGEAEVPADLGKMLVDFSQEAQSISAGLADLKKEVASYARAPETLKEELQELLSARLDELETKLAAGSLASMATSPAAPEQKEKLPTAKIVEEPEGQEEGARLPDYRKQEDETGEAALEFLSEEDILDVDKLRGIFQSVLDEDISDGHQSRDGEDTTADLLFLEEDIIGEDNEPEVTFSLDEKETAEKTN